MDDGKEPSIVTATTGKMETMNDGSVKMAVYIDPASARNAINELFVHGTGIAIAKLTQAANDKVLQDNIKEEGGTSSTEPDKKSEPLYGEQARALKLSGFFNNKNVWPHVGTDGQFREAIKRQVSCLDGNADYEDGVVINDPHHVTRSTDKPARSGPNPNKAPFKCIPLTHEQHLYKHDQGELATLKKWRPNAGEVWTVNRAKDWFDNEAVKYASLWAWATLKKVLGYDHWNDVPPEVMAAWAEEHKLYRTLPKEYKVL